MRFAEDVADLELADYQRAVRLLLRHSLITAVWPDERALPRVRRFSAPLRRDLADAFGYRLELHGSTARLVRTTDTLDPDRPAVSRTGRLFDRQRYAYLSLALAVIGRAGIQITLGELADAVAGDAGRIGGLGFDPDAAADRRALVDAVAWLEDRGVLRLTDGSTASWAGNPGAGEALYDIARDVVFALFRPARVLQHVGSAGALLHRADAHSGNAERRAAAQAARRAVVDSPVVYYSDVDPEIVNHLRGSALPADLQRLTGLSVERRAEGVLLVDTMRLSAEQFPGTGSVAQAAVLITAELAAGTRGPNGLGTSRMTVPDPRAPHEALLAQIDAGLPGETRVDLGGTGVDVGGADIGLGGAGETDDGAASPREPAGSDETRLPFVTDSFVRDTVTGILERYGSAFGAAWHADPERLRTEAVALLTRFGLVTVVPGGLLVRPLAGRYRATTAQLSNRRLF